MNENLKSRTHIRVLTLILSVMLIISMMPLTAFAEDADPGASETIEVSDYLINCILTPNGDGTYAMEAGMGTSGETSICMALSYDEFPYRDKITSVTVEDGVTELYIGCFSGFSNLKTAVLPESLKIIGDYAFNYDYFLSDIRIPDGVETIGKRAFNLCYSLEDITLPSALTSVGSSAFYSCGANPSEIVFPETISSVMKGRAVNDVHDEGAISPDASEGTTYLEQFDESYAKMLEIMDTLDFAGKTDYEKIRAVYDWVTANVEYDTEAAEREDTPGDTRHGYASTAHSALFANRAVCSGYTDLTMMMLHEAGIECFTSIGNAATGLHAWLIIKLEGSWYAADPTWDAHFDPIDYPFFLRSYQCFIEKDHTWEEGPASLGICTVSDTDYNYLSSGDYEYIDFGGDIYIRKYSGSAAKLTLPQEVNGRPVTGILGSAFEDCKTLKTLVIPEGYTTIGRRQFYNSSELSNVTLPSTLKTIGENVFFNIPLKTVTYNGTSAEFKKIKIANSGGENYSLMESTVSCTDWMYVPATGLKFADKKTDNYKYKIYTDHAELVNYTGTATSLTLPKTVTYNGKKYNITAVTETGLIKSNKVKTLVIPEGYVTLGDWSFQGFNNLVTVTLPTSLKKIGENVFTCVETYKFNYNGTKAQFKKIKVASGNYSLIESDVKCSDGKYKNPLNLDHAKVTVSSKKLTYNGKNRLPKITVKALDGTVLKNGRDYYYMINSKKKCATKNVDQYDVFIYGDGDYAGSNATEFFVIPVKTSISSLSAGKGSLTVKWAKKTTQVKGYQVQVATNSKFTSGKKTATITKNTTVSKKLTGLRSGKTYYVRVRTYKYGPYYEDRIYSNWSAVKKIRVR